jgi:glutamate-1-semialdehyde 2,1-aminomutase
VAAGLTALGLIDQLDPYPGLEAAAARLCDGIASHLAGRGIAHTVNREGSLFSLFLTEGPVTDYESARGADHEAFGRLFHGMLDAGIYLPPSGYEGWFLSTAHGDEEVDRTLEGLGAATS